MSLRLVKQQLAALSNRDTAELGSKEEKAAGKKDRRETRSKRKQSAGAVKKKQKKEAAAILSKAEVRERNLEYCKKSIAAEKSAELMMKVLHTQQVLSYSVCALLSLAQLCTAGIFSMRITETDPLHRRLLSLTMPAAKPRGLGVK